MASTIIFLNGTSSSGKTSILQSLQDQLQEPFLDMGIDRFIFMLPKRYLNQPLWDDVLGKAWVAECAQFIIKRLESPPVAFRNLKNLALLEE